MIHTVEIIINPASGIDVPILAPLNRELQNSSLDWNISVTKNLGEVKTYISKARKRKVDAIVVCGGDGTVTEAAKHLYKTKIPLCILPQGSANAIAKEFSIPLDIASAIKLLTEKRYQIQKVDMLKVNNFPTLIGMNAGFFAHVVKSTKRTVKDKVGQIAYGLTTLSQLDAIVDQEYILRLDGREILIRGVACYIVNIGTVGAVSIAPGIRPDDGFLDVVVIQQINLESFVEWAQSALSQVRPRNRLKHWKAKQVELIVPGQTPIMIDDKSITQKQYRIECIPHAVYIVVPKKKAI